MVKELKSAQSELQLEKSKNRQGQLEQERMRQEMDNAVSEMMGEKSKREVLEKEIVKIRDIVGQITDIQNSQYAQMQAREVKVAGYVSKTEKMLQMLKTAIAQVSEKNKVLREYEKQLTAQSDYM